jgi:SAM-dependent methyltransferase
MEKRPRQPSITLLLGETPHGINPGYQSAVRARSHILTQPFVVSKEPFFRRILDELDRRRESLCADGVLAVFEPGCGHGLFFDRLIEHVGRWNGLARLELTGADLSSEMILHAAGHVHASSRFATMNCDVSLVLASGVNCLDAGTPFHRDHLAPESFSLIMVSQFQHYFPNSPSSPLARRLELQGVNFSTKHEFRRHCHRLLRPGGMVFIIDDFRGRTEVEDEAWNRAWDRHVVRQFTSRRVIESIRKSDPRLAREIQRRYNPARGEAELVAVARGIRERRRMFCREEIETLDDALVDLREIFGGANSGVMAHPAGESHPNFFMVWAEKSRTAPAAG